MPFVIVLAEAPHQQSLVRTEVKRLRGTDRMTTSIESVIPNARRTKAVLKLRSDLQHAWVSTAQQSNLIDLYPGEITVDVRDLTRDFIKS